MPKSIRRDHPLPEPQRGPITVSPMHVCGYYWGPFFPKPPGHPDNNTPRVEKARDAA